MRLGYSDFDTRFSPAFTTGAVYENDRAAQLLGIEENAAGRSRRSYPPSERAPAVPARVRSTVARRVTGMQRHRNE